MDDVAVAAGVSKAAVSKVVRNAYGVSPAMRHRVESAIENLGYRPSIAARSLRGASFTLGIEIPQLGNDFFTQVMQGAAGRLAGSGYQLVIAPAMGEMKADRLLNALIDRHVDGVIAISPDVPPEWLEHLGTEIPIVLLGRHDTSANYDTLTDDDELGSRLVMEHLFELGHEEISHITVGVTAEVPDGILPHAIRRRTYSQAMAARGLPPRIAFTGPLEPDGYRETMKLLAGASRPTALFAGNDTLAIGALRARMELGLTATDFSIAGYDNIDLAAHPLASLTTVDQFGRESGAKAVELLLERIQQGRRDPRHVVITPVLQVRGSTHRVQQATR
jgi:LacI family transcriptional regulator